MQMVSRLQLIPAGLHSSPLLRDRSHKTSYFFRFEPSTSPNIELLMKEFLGKMTIFDPHPLLIGIEVESSKLFTYLTK